MAHSYKGEIDVFSEFLIKWQKETFLTQQNWIMPLEWTL